MPPLMSAKEETQPPRLSICQRWPGEELKKQQAIAIPLAMMNLTWFAKTVVTTIFLGHLGELSLAGGALGFTFANVTGFSVLTGLCCAMEPICGQAFGAKNYALMHRTLLMATLLLLLASIPISVLWLNVDKVMELFGQHKEITVLSKAYVVYLMPDLVVTSFLCPLKAYLSCQGVTVPILVSTVAALILHVPVNFMLSKAKGLQGVSMAVWLTDLSVVIMLAVYVFFTERRKQRSDGGRTVEVAEERKGWRLWWEQSWTDWVRLLRLSGPCCLTTCLEWWCYEILVLLTGRLQDAKQMVAVLAVVLNCDYLLYSIMLSLATCVSTRVSNELGAGRAQAARTSARVCLTVSLITGCIGGSAMAVVGRWWGILFSHDQGVVSGVRKMMFLMAVVEVVNFPLVVCGGIVRGTARPKLAMYATLGGFYLVALPLGILMGFKGMLGLAGLLLGFLVGDVVSAVVLLVLVGRIDWYKEAENAREMVGEEEHDDCEGVKMIGEEEHDGCEGVEMIRDGNRV